MIMRCYQLILSDPKEKDPFNPKRLQRTRKLLELLGGKFSTIDSIDNRARLETLYMQSSSFYESLKTQFGFERTSVMSKDGTNTEVLAPCPDLDFALIRSRLEECLGFSLSKEASSSDVTIIHNMLTAKLRLGTVEGQNGKSYILLPDKDDERDSNCVPLVIRNHSPGRSMVMDIRALFRYLLTHHDILTFDPRGTLHSTGKPSEEGFYCDIHAVMKSALTKGYEEKDIWINGYCEGAAPSLSLLATHPKTNFVIESPFADLLQVIETKPLGTRFGKSLLPAIQTKDQATLAALKPLAVQTDGFNNLAKIQTAFHETKESCCTMLCNR